MGDKKQEFGWKGGQLSQEGRMTHHKLPSFKEPEGQRSLGCYSKGGGGSASWSCKPGGLMGLFAWAWEGAVLPVATWLHFLK